MITLSTSKPRHEAWSGFTTAFQNSKFGMIGLRATFLSLLLLGIANSITAQPIPQNMGANVTLGNTVVIKGKVTSAEDGEVMAGVNVYLKGSQVGTATDADGQFEFPRKLNAGDVLVFSFVGFITQEITIIDQMLNLHVSLVFDSITAYGELTDDRPFTGEQPKGFRKLFRKTKAGI